MDTADLNHRSDIRRHVGYVSQLPERQLFAETVFDDVAIGPRNMHMSEDEVRSRVCEALASVNLTPTDELLARSPFSLSGGQQRSVALAGVRAMRQDVLVLDEPMAGLDTPVALADAAERLLSPLERLGVPVGQGALVLSIALRFVPTLSQEAEHIVAAQTARGADLENKGALAYARACVPLIVPLFASALRHADNLGRAMDARCYTGGERTHYHVMRLDAHRDAPAIAALAAYILLLVLLGVA